ncbi:MAG: oligosaccharide flippase family protein [Chloroflexi bacterium]|nr:oligosaccharide flippase family protein [Chloroflexota bacterium]
MAALSLRGSMVSMGASAITLTLGFARSLLLARLLLPEYYGVMTLALFFVNLLGRLRDTGFDYALVRSEQPSPAEVSTHFLLQVGTGVVMLVVGLLLIPILGHAYGDQRMLIPVFAALVAGRLLSTLGNTPLALLQRELGFDRVAGIDLIKAVIKTAGALALAYLGAGVWALVAEDLLEIVVSVVAVWIVRPVRLILALDREVARRYLRFGLPLFLSHLVVFLLMEFDDFWVGTTLGEVPLGFYAVAFAFAQYPRRVVSDPIQVVILSTYARLQTDRAGLSKAFYRASAYLVRVGFLAASTFALVAPEFIRVFIGEKWVPAVAAFRLLVIFGMSLPLVAVTVNLLVAVGESRRILTARLMQLAVFVPFVILGVWRWGILGAALASDMMTLVGLVIVMRMARRYVDYSPARLLAAPLLATGVAATVVWLVGARLPAWSDLWLMVAKGGLCVAAYSAVMVALERAEYVRAFALAAQLLRRREAAAP